jgi:hypothetical protein
MGVWRVTSARQTPSLGQLKLMLLWDSLRGGPHAGKQLQIYSFRSGDSAQSHEVLLKLAEKSGYSAEVYNKLEEFFKPRLPRPRKKPPPKDAVLPLHHGVNASRPEMQSALLTTNCAKAGSQSAIALLRVGAGCAP